MMAPESRAFTTLIKIEILNRIKYPTALKSILFYRLLKISNEVPTVECQLKGASAQLPSPAVAVV